MLKGPIRIAVDIGGTFTDLQVFTEGMWNPIKSFKTVDEHQSVLFFR